MFLVGVINPYGIDSMIYIFNSYNIDSESQIYLKSDEGIEDSIFKTYYDKKGQEYTKNHPELRN